MTINHFMPFTFKIKLKWIVKLRTNGTEIVPVQNYIYTSHDFKSSIWRLLFFY